MLLQFEKELAQAVEALTKEQEKAARAEKEKQMQVYSCDNFFREVLTSCGIMVDFNSWLIWVPDFEVVDQGLILSQSNTESLEKTENNVLSLALSSQIIKNKTLSFHLTLLLLTLFLLHVREPLGLLLGTGCDFILIIGNNWIAPPNQL